MKYRADDSNGDYQFGRAGIFDENSPAAVAHAIKTRLLLAAGEWFLDTEEGTAYDQILGAHTQNTRDLVVKGRILDTAGVTDLVSYESTVSGQRKFSVSATVLTAYSTQTTTITLES